MSLNHCFLADKSLISLLGNNLFQKSLENYLNKKIISFCQNQIKKHAALSIMFVIHNYKRKKNRSWKSFINVFQVKVDLYHVLTFGNNICRIKIFLFTCGE